MPWKKSFFYKQIQTTYISTTKVILESPFGGYPPFCNICMWSKFSAAFLTSQWIIDVVIMDVVRKIS